jgi:NAD(P)H-dependent FMN reductase
MKEIKALGLCGSLRGDSWNLKLLRNFLSHLQESGLETRLWPSLELPLFSEDLEKKPLDLRVTDFRAALQATSVVVVASPEYNGAYSAALKNAVDWATRPPENLWAGKIVVLLSASPGSLGGARGLIHLRTLLSGIKSWVIHQQVQLPFCDEAFNGEGVLVNEAAKKQIAVAVEGVKELCAKLL